MSGSQPMPPEQVADMLEEAEEVDRDAERAKVALEVQAQEARAATQATGDLEDAPSLVDRIKDLLDGDDESAPEAQPAEG